MKRLKFETQNELELCTLNYLVSKYNVPVSEINDEFDSSIADIAEEIAEFLVDVGYVKVLEEFECPEGCTGCDELKSIKE